MEEDKIVYMTAKQIRKKYPIDEAVMARIKALQDADIEPFFDEDCPDIDVYHPDEPKKHKESLLSKVFGFFRGSKLRPLSE